MNINQRDQLEAELAHIRRMREREEKLKKLEENEHRVLALLHAAPAVCFSSSIEDNRVDSPLRHPPQCKPR